MLLGTCEQTDLGSLEDLDWVLSTVTSSSHQVDQAS